MRNRYTLNARQRRTKARRPLRIDPTRTGGLRRKFSAVLRKRFALLRLELRKLIVGEDAFGLNSKKSLLVNVFCPTGEGGGVDPTCSPGTVGSPESRFQGLLDSIDRGQLTTPKIDEYIDSLRSLPKGEIDTLLPKLKISGKFASKGKALTQVRAILTQQLDAWVKAQAFNAFCPTGEGGGIDPSCSPSGAATTERLTAVVAQIDREKKRYGLVHLADVRAAFPKLSKAEFDAAIQQARRDGKLSLTGAEGRHGVSERDKEAAIHEKDFSGGSRALVYVSVRNALTTNAGRWAFDSDPEKIRKFKEWLKQQMKARLTSKTEEELWKRYVEEGFQKGAGRAFDDASRPERARASRRDDGGEERLDFYSGTKQQFLRDSFGRPETVDKVKLLAGRSFSDLEGITDDVSLRMARLLTDGLVQGKNPRDIARDLDEQLDLGRKRSEVIARTEIIRAHAEGQLTAFEQLGVEEIGVAVEWSTAGDERVCELCEALEGVVLRVDEARGMIPRHPQCLPGNSLVLPGGGVTAAVKRFYDGEVVVLRTASGRELVCTPNHPVLTDRGWIAAQLLHVGSHVVRDGRSQWEGAVDNNGQDVPSSIHDVAEAFLCSREVSAAKVPTSAPDFHGDGNGSQVAVVGTDCQLRTRENAALFQKLSKKVFVGRRVDAGSGLPSSRGPALFVDRFLAAACGLIGSGHLSGLLFVAHPRPLQDLSFAQASPNNAALQEPVFYGAPADTEPLGDGVLRVPEQVGTDDDFFWDRPQPAGNVLVAEHADDDLVGDAELARQLSSSRAGPVALDEVITLRVEKFVGHVYNLETESGWYAANGIIVHNCRCAFIPAGVGEDGKGQKTTKGQISEAIEESRRLGGDEDDDKGWGSGKAISKERPESIFNVLSELAQVSEYLTNNG